MANKEKIILMTKLASYENNEGRKDLKVMKRSKGDYISYNSFITCVLASIAVLIVFLADFSSKFIENLARFTDYDFIGDGIEYLTLWVLIMAVYSFLSGRMYRKEFDEADQRINQYKKDLKELGKLQSK